MAAVPAKAYLDELTDLYEAEAQAVRVLLRLHDAARTPELREALARQCDQARLHLERLQLIFTRCGAPLPPPGGGGLPDLVRETDDRLHQAATPEARDAAIAVMAQCLMHEQAGRYGRARLHARRLDHPDEARLLQETMDEDGRAGLRLSQIAGNRAVLSSPLPMTAIAPLDAPPPAGKLR
jgi:ferritin-like metal-binding protein YciE